MALVLTQTGAQLLLDVIFRQLPMPTPNIHLIGSAYTVLHTTTLSDLSAVELSVGGYAPIAINPAAGVGATADAVGAALVYVPVFWTLTGACSIYGYWLSDDTNAVALWAEDFSLPFTYGSGGGTFPLTLAATLHSQPPWPPTTSP